MTYWQLKAGFMFKEVPTEHCGHCLLIAVTSARPRFPLRLDFYSPKKNSSEFHVPPILIHPAPTGKLTCHPQLLLL